MPQNELTVAGLVAAGALVAEPVSKVPTAAPEVVLESGAPRIRLSDKLTRRVLAAAAAVDVLALAEKHGVEVGAGVPVDHVRLAIAAKVFEGTQ